MPPTDYRQAARDADATWWTHSRRCRRCADGLECARERQLERQAQRLEAAAYGVAA